jgi:hypothetical protein
VRTIALLVQVYILTSFGSMLEGQHLVGLHKKDVIGQVKVHYPDFKQETGFVNKAYKYLKFYDRYNEQTLLCFLSEDDYCTRTQLHSDYSNKPGIVEKLNRRYTKVDDNTWNYSEGFKIYEVVLKESEWYFSVITREKKNIFPWIQTN